MIETASSHSSLSWRGYIAYAAAFTLPLGFAGVVAIPLMLILEVVHLATSRANRAAAWRGPWLYGLPLAVLTVGSTLAGPNARAGLLPSAVGVALLYTLGLESAHALVKSADRTALLEAFLLGDTVLAISVIADALLRWHHVPAGLFWYGGLQNWSATLLALGFPLGLWATRLPGSGARRIGALAAVLTVVGVLAGLSWVGAFGLLVGLVFLTTHRLRYPLLATVLVTTLITAGAVFLLYWLAHHSQISIGGYTPADLGEIVFARLRIMVDGLALASLHPWSGWGWGAIRAAFAQHPLGVFYMDDLVIPHFHNLYVQTLFQTGALGLAALALLIGGLYWNQRGPLTPGVRAALLAFLATQVWNKVCSRPFWLPH